jgi:DNA (cytosine-5)-methyltransferase 1
MAATEPPLDLHFKRQPTEMSLKRYRAIPHEGMNRFDLQRIAPELTPSCWIKKKSGGTDLFGRLWWDRPAFTVRTEFFKPEKGRYLHPVQDRPVTHREAARFQSFPDNFKFVGSKISVARQIGNAVPPLLAASVARCVYALFGQQETEQLEAVRKTRDRTLENPKQMRSSFLKSGL